MRAGEVFDVDVIAHAGAIRGRVVGAENSDVIALADGRLAGDFDQQRGIFRGLADAACRIRARDIEIAQRDVTQIGSGGEVAQHPFGHQLGQAVGVDRRDRGVFGDLGLFGDAIDGRRRGKYEALDAVSLATAQQVARAGGVVAIVFERVCDRLGHDRVGGEMHDGVHRVLLQQAADQLAIAGIADDQVAMDDRIGKTGAEVIEHHHVVTGFAELADHMAADITGAAGDENGVSFGHDDSFCPRR